MAFPETIQLDQREDKRGTAGKGCIAVTILSLIDQNRFRSGHWFLAGSIM